jgi:L-iditol 2-dehydrogenase
MYNLCSNMKEIGSSVNGGFAEFVQIPRPTLRVGGIIPVPNKMRDEEASLIEPLSCCINGLSRLDINSIDDNHTVCIIGDGPIGLIHLRLLGLIGVRSIVVGRVDSRMKTAKSMGADAVVDANMNPGLTAKVVSDLTNGIGADIVIVVASDPSALTLATKVASKNAKISLFAGMPKGTSLSLDANLLHYNQISLIGNFSATPDSMREAINLISQNRLDLSEMISHYYPLHNIEEALAATESFRGLRIVINRF